MRKALVDCGSDARRTLGESAAVESPLARVAGHLRKALNMVKKRVPPANYKGYAEK